MKNFLLIISIFILNVKICKSQLSVDLESGVAAFGYNDVRIPGNNATLFSLTDDLNAKTTAFFRGRLQYDIGKRHAILALYAPLTIKSTGTFNRNIIYQNQTFQAGDPINSTWMFNSYRISYQYNLILKERFLLALGVTGKIRDAKITVSSPDRAATKSNLGFVPLLRFYMDWNFSKKLHLILDGDALASKQGRAEDVLLAINYNIAKNLGIKAGYRILEGGANNEEVYNFSAVNYGVVGLTYKFW